MTCHLLLQNVHISVLTKMIQLDFAVFFIFFLWFLESDVSAIIKHTFFSSFATFSWDVFPHPSCPFLPSFIYRPRFSHIFSVMFFLTQPNTTTSHSVNSNPPLYKFHSIQTSIILPKYYFNVLFLFLLAYKTSKDRLYILFLFIISNIINFI